MGREKVQRTGHHGEVHALNRSRNVNVSIIWLMLKQVPKMSCNIRHSPGEDGDVGRDKSDEIKYEENDPGTNHNRRRTSSSTFSPVLHLNIETFKSYEEIKYKFKNVEKIDNMKQSTKEMK